MKQVLVKQFSRLAALLFVALLVPMGAWAWNDDAEWTKGTYGSWPINSDGYNDPASEEKVDGEFRYTPLGYWLYPAGAAITVSHSGEYARVMYSQHSCVTGAVLKSGNKNIVHIGNYDETFENSYGPYGNKRLNFTYLQPGQYAGTTVATVEVTEYPQDRAQDGYRVEKKWTRSFVVTNPATILGITFAIPSRSITWANNLTLPANEITEVRTNLYTGDSSGYGEGESEFEGEGEGGTDDQGGYFSASDYPTSNIASQSTWSSSDEDVATVNPTTGEVTIVGCGSTRIYMNFPGNDKFPEPHSSSYIVFVEKSEPRLSFSRYSKTYTFGEEFTQVELTKQDADGLEVVLTSSDESVAKIVDGMVVPVGAGQCTIKATIAEGQYNNAAQASYILYVEKGTPTLSFGDETSFSVDFGQAFVAPELQNPQELSVTYTSSNEQVATVATDGNVTIVGAGETTITAAFAGNEQYNAAEAKYTLTVNEVRAKGYGITVLGEEVTEVKTSGDISKEYGTGSWTFDPDTRTLSITGMNIKDAGMIGLKGGIIETAWAEDMKDYSFTIVFNGENKAANVMGGIMKHHPGLITIKGGTDDASLTLSGNYYMLNGDFTIDGIATSFTADWDCFAVGSLVMQNGASMYAKSKEGELGYFGSLTLNDGIKIQSEGVAFQEEGADSKAGFYKDGALVTEVYIAPDVETEPIKEETTETPAETAVPGEATTSEEGVTTSLGEDDEVDTAEGSVTMHKAYTTEELDELLETVVPGSSAFNDAFKGIYFMLAAGKGYVEMDIETLGNYVMKVVSGTELIGEYVKDYKGTIRIEYNITEDTWFFAFTGETEAAPARGKKAQRRSPDSTNGLKIYSVKIVPQEVVTGISETRQQDAGYGHIYNINGQRVSSLTKGLFIIDGKKVVVK